MKKYCTKCGDELPSSGTEKNRDTKIIDELLGDVCNNCLSSDELMELNSWVSSCTCKRDG